MSGDLKIDFPIVGMGASAGGLAALSQFLAAIPAHPGMAFVIVQHLSPDQPSLLTELLQRETRLKVLEIQDGMQVQPDQVYVLSPNHDLTLEQGCLQLLEPGAPRGHRLPIDFFFRSLAHSLGERAVGIVFSGTGSDGTLGARTIKDQGGLMLAQSPESAEHDGMPRSAIATGLIDSVMAPAAMPAWLLAYVDRAQDSQDSPVKLLDATGELDKLYGLLHSSTGHDFSKYKQSTFLRRTQRRMAVHQCAQLGDYLRYLESAPAEVQALFRDLLIGVTSFFRDPDAFAVLEAQVLPRIFADKCSGGSVRVWAPGCSTGQEAYSLAILLQECLEDFKLNLKLQVFATDIDTQAIDLARTGRYPRSIESELSAERLARFFVLEPEGDGYRVQKGIRDILIFSVQDVLRDPPFSKLDLISCRNLLIYVNGEVHRRLIPVFHYALSPGGYLFLGSSESVGEFQELFGPVDRTSKLYRRRENPPGAWRAPPGMSLAPWAREVPSAPKPAPRPLALNELTERLLLRDFTPAAALVNERGEILYLHNRTGAYLEPAQGEADLNLLKMARAGLRRGLTNSLHKAVSEKRLVRCPGLKVKSNGGFTRLDLTVAPIANSELLLVVFQEAAPAGGAPRAQRVDDDQVEALTRELRANEEYLQTTLHEMEAGTQELRSSHEEMQSVNEELQSANEELQTSKEELQSVNEELATVNAELQSKVLDLFRANNDLNNLLAGTGVATIFVDHQLRIQRFTPAVTAIINLIQSDVGRPVGHIVSNLSLYQNLVEDVQGVLDTLQPAEVEVQAHGGAWFLLRIRPYRTLENVIEGAVILFFDITRLKTTEIALRESEARYRELSERSSR